MAWTHVPATDVDGEYWIDYSTPGYPLMTRTNPALGFSDKNAALESLYMPMAGGNMAQLQQLIAANPDAYAKFGITPQNAAQQTDSTFYDRLHNIDNDPLANFMNPLIEGGIKAAVGAGLGNFAGLTNFGDGSWLDKFFGPTAADGITSTMASGANPTQVGGSYFAEGLGPNWADLPSYADSGGWESWLPDANNVYNPVSANDPIGELIRQLDNGVPSADALKAVESALPGTTRSALEQFLYNAGTGASGLLKGLGSTLGLTGAGGSTDGFSLSKLLGAVGPGIGGYLASNAQADAYRDIANKQLGEGQWARDMLKQSYADPNAYLQGEGKTFLDDAAKRQAYALSTGGNPIGSGNQLTQMMSDAYARNAGALGTYRGGLTSAGYGVPYQAGSQAQMNAVGQQGAGWNALGSIGSGINDIFNPKPTAAQTLAELLKLK